jgi:ubiquinone/menaquinone biosynthesis C-methylase UbiE
VLDSAEVPGDVILTDVLQRRRALRQTSIVRADSHAGALNEALEHVEELMSVEAVAGILEATWGLERGTKILHLGSGAGHMVAALRALGFNATGVECSREASLTTPVEFSKRNFHCDFAHLPFEDEEFDAVIETGLYRLEPKKVESAIAELHRVARCGVLLGSVTSDLAIDPTGRFNLLEGAPSRWDWAERFYAAGFVHALFERPVHPSGRHGRGASRLAEAWENAEASGVAPGEWYEDSESLLYCVYERASKPDSQWLKQAPAADANANSQELVAVG